MPCRINRRRLWMHRLILEGTQHESSSFVTLTYRPGEAPSDGSVSPEHLRNWLKRFRKAIEPVKIRYYGVGEYGGETWRPHYHVALFGWPSCMSLSVGECPCQPCSVVRGTWGFGHVSVLPLVRKTCQYIAGYVVKRMTLIGDPRLEGRLPEFCRMSLRPGIGAGAMFDVASELMRYKAGVPTVLRTDGRFLPLGRYLRLKLEDYSGSEREVVEDATLSMVRTFAFNHSRSVKGVYEELYEGVNERLAARQEGRRL